MTKIRTVTGGSARDWGPSCKLQSMHGVCCHCQIAQRSRRMAGCKVQVGLQRLAEKVLQNGLVQGRVRRLPMKRLQAHARSFTFMELRGTHLDIGDNAKMSKKFEVARAGSTLEKERLEIDVTEGSECADALSSLGTRCAVITQASEVVLPVTTSTTQTRDLPRLQKSQKSAQAPKMEAVA